MAKKNKAATSKKNNSPFTIIVSDELGLEVFHVDTKEKMIEVISRELECLDDDAPLEEIECFLDNNIKVFSGTLDAEDFVISPSRPTIRLRGI